MAKRVISYLAYIDNKLLEYANNKDYSSNQLSEDIRRHLIQISLFQHERLIHLIVTVLFAILTVGSFFFVLVNFSIWIFGLTILLLILLVPYIKHYYLLENSVQKMYTQYDKMLSYLDSCNK